MTRKFSVGTLALLLCCLSGFAQNLSNKGTEFWVGYGHHQFFEASGGNGQEMVVYLSAEQAATVTVSITGTSYSQTYNVPANSVISTTPIPKSGSDDARLYDGGTSEGIFNKGIHIQSNVPIVAYAHIYGSASSGATMLMPAETWGYSYVSLNSKQEYGIANCHSWMYVVAKENNTKVEITPKVATRGGKPAGVPFTVVLNKGQIYQVLGAAITTTTGYEMSGSTVRSVANSSGECFPIAVFSGSSRTSNPASCGSGGGDNDMQQLFPFQAWGKRYLLAPLSNSGSASSFQTNTYKILVKDPNTVVKRNGITIPQSSLTSGSYYLIETSANAYITADQPIMVGQFMTGGACIANGSGDPEMIYLSPIEQGIKRVGFYRNNQQAIGFNYLTLIIPTAGLSSLTIDGVGASGFSYSYAHPNLAGYTVVIKRWTVPLPPSAAPGQCIVQSDSAFTAVTYGLGSVESYGYNAGTLINNLNVKGSIFNTLDSSASVTEHPYTCKNTPFELSMLIAYQPTSMVWKLSNIPQLSPNANVTVTAPTPSATVVINGVTYYKYTLPGNYVFSDTGTFQIPVRTFHPALDNCNNSEDVSFTIVSKKPPKTDFSYTHTGCLSDSVAFSSPVPTGNGYNAVHWKWTFDDGTTATGANVTKLFGTPGAQNIKLDIVTTEGCLGDTSRAINIFNKPQVTIGASSLGICQGGNVSFTDTASYAGNGPIVGYYWDLGNGTTSTANLPPAATYPNWGTITVKHVVKVSNTCISDTATKVITVYSKPALGFTYPAGCLPSDGIVHFNNTTTTPDNQNMTYSWNFGDPNASGSNPNTSTQQSPTHTYAYGTYTIQYTATTVNGCSKDTSVTTTFNLAPVLAFSALSPVCENTTGSVSIANGSVSNAVPGTGYYSGPATTAAGQFTPSAAGAGTHTVWYVFNSTAGCKDSISQTIQVYARPKPGFTFPTGCLAENGMVQFTNATTVSDGQTMSYSWTFADPNASGSNPNTSTQRDPTHNYTNTGTYAVKLAISTPNGCSSDTTINATFSVKPDLSFNTLANTCQNAAAFSAAAASVGNGVTGTGTYSGPGTTAAGQFNPATAGAGTHTITYIFNSTGGCADTATQSIIVYPKPTASFTVDNNICLNQQATVTDASTVPSGYSITTWNWNFGNGVSQSSSTGTLPALSYATANTYTIKLVTISNQNCVSDTASQVIGVRPMPAPNFKLPTAICMPNGSGTFTNTSTIGDNTNMSYQWTFGDGSGPSNNTNPTHTYATASGPVNVKLVATSSYGCVKDTTIVLSAFFDKPLARFSVSPDTLCQGTPNVFTNASTAPNSTVSGWSWSFGDGTTSGDENPTKKYTQYGNFPVTLTVKNAAGCTSDPEKKNVVVYLQPKIDAGPSFVVLQGTVITFRPVVNGTTGVNFTWTPSADFPNASVLTPSITATHNQTYTLTAIGEGNCAATDTMTVRILKKIQVPNAFSPNGDGVNDTWVIPNLIEYPGCTVEVFNRYGQPVYQNVGYGKPWDGTFNSKPLPYATYYYIITPKNGIAPVTGSVTIIK